MSNPHEGEREQPVAFALMKVKGTISDILHKLKSFPNFLEANVIPGEFDIVAAFRGHNPREVSERCYRLFRRLALGRHHRNTT